MQIVANLVNQQRREEHAHAQSGNLLCCIWGEEIALCCDDAQSNGQEDREGGLQGASKGNYQFGNGDAHGWRWQWKSQLDKDSTSTKKDGIVVVVVAIVLVVHVLSQPVAFLKVNDVGAVGPPLPSGTLVNDPASLDPLLRVHDTYYYDYTPYVCGSIRLLRSDPNHVPSLCFRESSWC